MSDQKRPSMSSEQRSTSVLTASHTATSGLNRRQFLGFGAAGLAGAALLSSPLFSHPAFALAAVDLQRPKLQSPAGSVKPGCSCTQCAI